MPIAIIWAIAAGLTALGIGGGAGVYIAAKEAGKGVQGSLDQIGQGLSEAEQKVATGVNVALMLAGGALALYALNKSKH